jgi:tetratricopeptide (TPR) repeat protein
MNQRIMLLVVISLLFIASYDFYTPVNNASSYTVSREQVYRNRNVMGCTPDWTQLDTDSMAAGIVPLPGWGTYKWNIGTRSDSAQFYFNQGINMYYAFHIIESMASFKKAALFDPNNPMIYWGQALAYGPNINDFAYAATPDAVSAIERARELSATSGQRDKALIAAMLVRYSNDSTISRQSLNQLYADSMKAVYARFPNDADVGALYADALMVQHPWEYWKHNGAAHPWTPAILKVLENVLRFKPNHPGANHFYIHAVEASPHPEKALPSANRLGDMMPAVSHMVHMPSHIYIRTGNYQQGMTVNDRSLKGYDKYLELYPLVQNNAFLYELHNLHMKAACAMMRPVYAAAIKSAEECAGKVDSGMLSLPHPLGNFAQYVWLTPQMAQVRYGKWNEVLAAADPDKKYVFAFVLQKWAKGIAFANLNKIAEAKNELAQLNDFISHPDLQVRLDPFNKPAEQAQVALCLLKGTIAFKENEISAVIESFTAAVKAEDDLIYTEPRDWLLPARHYLAQALIKAGKYKEAKNWLTEDLRINPFNGYALYGMEEIASKERDFANQAKYNKLRKKAFAGSDLPYPSLLY